MTGLRALCEQILEQPTATDLWALQKLLLGDERGDAQRAWSVVRAFHACLRALESKSASRQASRWGAILGTAAVGTTSLPELREKQGRELRELVEDALPAFLEVGASIQTAQAWEIDARLIYDEFAWFLYEELWDISVAAHPELTAEERRDRIDAVLDPILGADLPDADRASLVIDVFRSVLAARILPLLR
ncbi:MAG TPA: hypothetical protein VJ850_07710 [Candidatus Limnocylindrales bacterium]|nr:hypothetical protein [Candidatus Limnocylindrales bacterium]